MSDALTRTNELPRCEITGNPVGTDTQNPLHPCPCLLCLAHRIGCSECEALAAEIRKLGTEQGELREYCRIKDEQIAGLRAKLERLGSGMARANKAIGRRNRQNAAMGQEIENLKNSITITREMADEASTNSA